VHPSQFVVKLLINHIKRMSAILSCVVFFRLRSWSAIADDLFSLLLKTRITTLLCKGSCVIGKAFDLAHALLHILYPIVFYLLSLISPRVSELGSFDVSKVTEIEMEYIVNS